MFCRGHRMLQGVEPGSKSRASKYNGFRLHMEVSLEYHRLRLAERQFSNPSGTDSTLLAACWTARRKPVLDAAGESVCCSFFCLTLQELAILISLDSQDPPACDPILGTFFLKSISSNTSLSNQDWISHSHCSCHSHCHCHCHYYYYTTTTTTTTTTPPSSPF